MTCSIVLSILGLGLEFIAGVILLRSIFITDEEIELLAQLPIAESGTKFTEPGSRVSLPAALIHSTKLKEYRDTYIEARKKERNHGRLGLSLLTFGFVLQLVGQALVLL